MKRAFVGKVEVLRSWTLYFWLAFFWCHKFYFLYVWCMHVCTGVRACSPVWIQVKARGLCQDVFFNCFPAVLLLLESRSIIESEAICSGAPRILWDFMWVVHTHTQALTFAQQTLYIPSHLLQPSHCFKHHLWKLNLKRQVWGAR